MEEYTDKVVTISKVGYHDSDYKYAIEEDYGNWLWDEEWFEPAGVVKTKEDLKDGDIITLGNGDRLLFSDGFFNDIDEKHDNYIGDLFDLNVDLTYSGYSTEESNNVVKVERPLTYYEVFNRNSEVKIVKGE